MTNTEEVFDKEATPEDLKKAKEGFWAKMHEFIGRVPFARQAVALFYMIKDPRADLGVKGAAVLALLYFISPVDAIPDVVPVAGLMDDAAVISTALMILGGLIKPYLQLADDWYHKGAKLKDEPEVIKDAEVLS